MASERVEAALAAVADREAVVRAWAFVDPDRARREAASAFVDRPLSGCPVAVKDVFDTADLPTEYGSQIYAGHQPRADAAAVALLRRAGATVVGKTVTAELGWFTAGPTTNPHRATHTPGGSSSGSAAAVAAGMADLALGAQTAGSVIRPASFCGVFGYKPTFGHVATSGVKQAAPSLDTVGLFARDVATLELARAALTGRIGDDPGGRPTFALVRTDLWDGADDDSKAAVETAAAAVRAKERALPDAMVGLASRQPVVQAFEGVRALAWEWSARRDDLSTGLREILAWGDAIAAHEYDEVVARAAKARDERVADALFGPAQVLITPAVVGEAPEGLAGTGDPRFCRLWTLLGWPAVTVPGQVGATGMPVGVQLVARPGDDARLLRAADALANALR